MPKAYSMDLRQRVIGARDQGGTIAEVAARFAVSDSFVEKLTRRWRESGTLAPGAHRGGRPPVLSAFTEQIRAQLQEQPDTTLEELRARLGLSVSLSTLWTHLRRLDLTWKKNTESRRTGPSGCAS